MEDSDMNEGTRKLIERIFRQPKHPNLSGAEGLQIAIDTAKILAEKGELFMREMKEEDERRKKE